MTNVVQEFEKFKNDQNQKIAEFKEHISKVIEEFLNATQKFSERDDLRDLFIKWNYNFTDEICIFILEKEDGMMQVWEQVTYDGPKNAYLYVYNKNVFEEMNTFLEKTFSWLGFRIRTNAHVMFENGSISIQLEFEPCENIYSLVPDEYVTELYVKAMYRAMATILKQAGAERVDNDNGNDDIITVTYHLS